MGLFFEDAPFRVVLKGNQKDTHYFGGPIPIVRHTQLP